MIKKDCNFWNNGCEFSGKKEDRDCDGCLEYDKEKKIVITSAKRKLLKRELAERMRIRERKQKQRREHYYK